MKIDITDVNSNYQERFEWNQVKLEDIEFISERRVTCKKCNNLIEE